VPHKNLTKHEKLPLISLKPLYDSKYLTEDFSSVRLSLVSLDNQGKNGADH